jgi:hypothetical protein
LLLLFDRTTDQIFKAGEVLLPLRFLLVTDLLPLDHPALHFVLNPGHDAAPLMLVNLHIVQMTKVFDSGDHPFSE